MTEAGEVAEALGIREAELREAVDDDTTAAALLGQFTPDVPLPEAKAAVEAWLAGEPVTESNGNRPADAGENPSEGKDNESETHDGDGMADADEARSTGTFDDSPGYRPGGGTGLLSHRELLETAQARAGREPWDFVKKGDSPLDWEPINISDTRADTICDTSVGHSGGGNR